MFLKRFKNSERGSVTVFVLSTMLLVVGVVFVSYFSMMNKSSSQATELNKIQEEYNPSDEMMEQAYEESKSFGQNEIAEKNEEYIDINGDIATIPEGFKILEGKNVIRDGLVVQDVDGNEFVWIPVEIPVANKEENGTNSKAMAIKNGNNYRGLLYDFSNSNPVTSTVISQCTTTTDGDREPDIVVDYDNNTDYNNGLFTKESLQQEYNKMMASVEKYKGFYVGRYELGLQETQAVSKNANIIENVTTAEASNTNTNMWYGLYSKCKEYAPESSNKSVVSSMIWGSQYNAMLNWMAKQGEPVGTIDNNKFNSTGTTGNNSNDVIRNIFDLYGCHREWTLEASANNLRISYGGDFGSSASPSNYTGNSPIDENVNISTRFSLYIK